MSTELIYSPPMGWMIFAFVAAVVSGIAVGRRSRRPSQDVYRVAVGITLGFVSIAFETGTILTLAKFARDWAEWLLLAVPFIGWYGTVLLMTIAYENVRLNRWELP